MSRSLICSIAAAGLLTGAVGAQQPTNLGFEAYVNGRATGWSGAGNGYEIVADSVAPFAGRYSLRTRWMGTTPRTADTRAYAAETQAYPLALAAGRKLHLTGYIRTQGIQTGFAGFLMRVDSPNQGVLAFDNMQQRGPRGTTPWTRYDIELPVDSGAAAVYIGLMHPGDGTAWFDSITVEVVGPPMPRMVAAVRPESRPTEDMTRLLTDPELALARDSIAVPEDAAYSAWVKTNAKPIRSLGSTNFSDLRFLAPLLTNKRIVQLGESGNGVAEFDLAKVRLIKYLHEELGYDVMAFESSIYECERAQKDILKLSALDLMRACISSVWHTSETLPLFDYIKQTQRTKRPLILAGFDEQTSSVSVDSRPTVFRSAISSIDTAYARRVYETDTTFLRNREPGNAYLTANRDRLVAFYDSLAVFLRIHRREIEAAHRDDPNLAVITRQAAVSMTFFVRQLAAGADTSGSGGDIRDLGMANNLDFLLNDLYPGKKVIVWAHNAHIQHREHTARVPRSMGTWVADRHRKEVYTIGLFMYRGSAATNDRRPYSILQSRSGSLESILHRAPWRYSFVDFSQATKTRGSEWMWNRLTGLSWGRTVELFVPRDEYDGVLFIDKVHVPTYR